MDITPQLLEGSNFINGYSDKGFKVNGKWNSGNILLTPSSLHHWDIEGNIFALDNYNNFINNFLKNCESNSIVMIGTGARHESPPNELYTLFQQYNISPEVMSTPAACRTYNVLMAEQRNVFALLKRI